MPRLNNISNQSVQNTGPGPQMNPNAGDARFRAQAGVGAAMVQAGAVLQDFSNRKQQHINQGILANEESMRIDLEAQMQQFIDSNPDDVRSWALERQKLLNQYKKDRAKRMDGVGSDVREVDENKLLNWESRTGAVFQIEQNKALIRKSNAQIEGLAQQKLRQGDHDGFMEEMNKLDATKEQKDEKIRRGLEQGLYNMGEIQLQNLNTVEEIEDYKKWLNEKDSSGNYSNLEFEKGGISFGARTQLERYANSRINQIQRAQLVEEARLQRKLETGEAGMYDIEQAELANAVSPEYAEAAKRQVALVTEAETTGTVDAFGDQTQAAAIRDEMSVNWFWSTVYNARQPTRKETEDILGRIVNAELSKETKNVLLQEWLSMKSADLNDNEEERSLGWKSGGAFGFFDRKISESEKIIRQGMIEEYRKRVNDLGILAVGRMAQLNEKKVQDYFDSNPEATVDEAKSFLKEEIINPMILESITSNPGESTLDILSE